MYKHIQPANTSTSTALWESIFKVHSANINSIFCCVHRRHFSLFGNAIIIAFEVLFRRFMCLCVCASVYFWLLILKFSHTHTHTHQNDPFIWKPFAIVCFVHNLQLSSYRYTSTLTHTNTNTIWIEIDAKKWETINWNQQNETGYNYLSSVITMISILLPHDAISTFRSAVVLS